MGEMNAAAANSLGKSVLFQAQAALYDEVADIAIAVFDDVTGVQGTPTYTPGSMSDPSHWEISSVTEGEWAGTGLVSIKNASGTETFVNFATGLTLNGEDYKLSANEREAAVLDANAIAADPIGKTVLPQLPDAMLDAVDQESRSIAYDAADAPSKAAIQEFLNNPPTAPTKYVRKQQIIRNGRQDRSRVSKEYHEWRYNVVTSGDYERMTLMPAGKGIAYIGADKIILESTAWAPPYHRWIQYDDFRELHKIWRRYKRARNSCGGKNLWADQGFANKHEAIADDCENDAEFQSLVANLDATSNWATTT